MRHNAWTRRLTALCALMLLLLAAPAARAEESPLGERLAGLDASELTELRELIDLRLRALGEYPFVKLSEGSRGDEVTALQKRLKELGYFTDEPDGRYRQKTVNAMKAFEKAAGLKRDGAASVEDQKALFADAAPAQPTPTPSPTPKPTRTPNIAKDYERFDFRLAGLMPEKYAGSRYRVTGRLLALLEDGRWLVELDDGLVAVQRTPAEREIGSTVSVWGEYAGLTAYESESGPVTLPLINCEHLE